MKVSFNEIELFRDNKFIPLGRSIFEIPKINPRRRIFKKLKRNLTNEVDGIWGTLGWADDSPFYLNGTISFSEEGNYDEGTHNGNDFNLTKKEIEDLKLINPSLDINKPGQVKERYINFDEIDFDLPKEFNSNDIPKLRLTLFLKRNEGALVYYQHSNRNEIYDENSFIEYILNNGEENEDSDRLTYIFPIEPNKKIEIDQDSNKLILMNEDSETSSIIKILTFKRKETNEDLIFESQLKRANFFNKKSDGILYELVGKEKYNLLIFDKTLNKAGDFFPVNNKDQIKNNLKTLFLIHGTFVNTHKSYKDLLLFDEELGYSTLQYLIDSGKFEQIIAFDHPTISEDAEQNVEWLLKKFKELDIVFELPLQIITTSRGALIAEFMVSNVKALEYIPVIDKVMMFSAANGCGYFRVADRIPSILSIWKTLSPGPASKIILSIAQLSIKWFLNQPGCILMNENHDVLKSILNQSPLNNNLEFISVVSDWKKCLNDDLSFINRLKNTSLDGMIRLALGKEHDWVIGCENQRMVLPNSKSKIINRISVHGRYLEKGYVKEMVEEECELIKDPHEIIIKHLN